MTDAHPADTGRVQLVFKRLNRPRRHQRREGTWAGGCSAERVVTAAPRTLPYKALKPPLRPAPARGPLPPMRSCGAPIGRGRRRPPSPRGRDRGYNSAHRPVRGAAQRTARHRSAPRPTPLLLSSQPPGAADLLRLQACTVPPSEGCAAEASERAGQCGRGARALRKRE